MEPPICHNKCASKHEWNALLLRGKFIECIAAMHFHFIAQKTLIFLVNRHRQYFLSIPVRNGGSYDMDCCMQPADEELS